MKPSNEFVIRQQSRNLIRLVDRDAVPPRFSNGFDRGQEEMVEFSEYSEFCQYHSIVERY
jgi:hypothetical protein